MTNTDFVKLMFANAAPAALPWVTAFASAPGAASRGQWAGWPVRREGDVPRGLTMNAYVTLSTYTPMDGRYRRRKAQFSAMHCLMVDDIGVKVSDKAIALAFTVEVETSPGNRQGWYRLDPPITDRALGERLITRMVEAGLTSDGTDPGMKGVTRYGRLPQGWNNKPSVVTRCGGPWRHLVTACRSTISYTLEEVVEAYELDLTAPPERVPAMLRTSASPECSSVLGTLRMLDMYLEPLGNGWHAVVCPWVAAHTSRVTTGTAYAEPSADNNFIGGFKCHHGHCEKSRGIGELLRFCEKVQDQIRERHCA